MAESVREHLSGVSFAILTYHGDIIGEKGVIISSCCTESLRSLEKDIIIRFVCDAATSAGEEQCCSSVCLHACKRIVGVCIWHLEKRL